MLPHPSKLRLCRAVRHPPGSRHLRATPDEGGFLLVPVLLIIALVTVLIVTTAMVARIERLAAANTVNVERARANALLALDAALDQLQREAGPDQRVTARADIRQAGSATVNQPYWTGVWKSYNPTNASVYELDAGTTPLRPWSTNTEGPTWLVSNPNSAATLSPASWTGTTTGTNPDAVKMATIGATTNVIVPRVDVVDADDTSKVVGKFAYWVADEGIKAKVSLVPNAASGNGTDVARYLAPAAPAAELALEGAWRTAMGTLLAGNATTDLSKVRNPAMLDFVLGGNFSTAGDGLAASSPDITTHSFSVLSNTKKGGLKTDLTAAFENSGNWNETSQFKTLTQREVVGYVAPAFSGRAQADDAGGLLWRVHSDSNGVAKANAGARWHTLFHYYNLYKAALPPMPSPVVAGAPQPPAGLGGQGGNSLAPRWAELDVPDSQFLERVPAGVILPVPLGFKAELAVSSYQINNGADGIAGNADDEFGLRLHYIPALVMWNPFDVGLTEPSLNGNRTRYIFAGSLFKINAANTKLRLSAGGWTEDLDILPSAPDASGTVVPFDTFSFQIKDGEKTFAPGEIRVFGLDTDAPLPPNNYIPPLTKNFVEGFSVYRDLPLTNKLTRNQALTVAFQEQVIAANANYHVESANGYPARVASPSAAGAPNPQNRFEGLGSSAGMAGSTSFVNVLNITPPQIEGIGSLQRVFAYMSRVKGRVPENTALQIPTQGGPGTFLNTAVLSNSVIFWDDLHRTGAGFLSNEEFQNDGNGRSFWGEFDLGVPGGLAGAGRRVQFELPRTPLLSLGQFRNVRANFPASMVTVGNSWPSPELALPAVSDAGTDLTRFEDNVQDDNWLNNDALFDGFFFSTVPPASRASSTAYPSAWGNAVSDFTQSKVDSGTPLLNPRLKYHPRADGSAPLLADLQDMDKAAAHLMLDGGFNINSTSVPAWRALLASLRLPNQPGSIPIPRFIQTLSSAPTTENIGEGRRVLTDMQVDALAGAIVEQVKLRGPFLSMADFINRRREDSALGRKGALQAAIDTSGINDAARAALGSQPFAVPDPFSQLGSWNSFNTTRQTNMRNNSAADSYDTAMGEAGMITQADLLQYLAPVLVARSDTFCIRVFGETLNRATGRTEAEAWGEAIVQREPEFLDASDAAHTPLATLKPTNAKFGRRFKIVAFRWLSSDEI